MLKILRSKYYNWHRGNKLVSNTLITILFIISLALLSFSLKLMMLDIALTLVITGSIFLWSSFYLLDIVIQQE